MELTAGNLAKRLPQVEADATLGQALYEMRQEGVSVVALVREGHLVGFITEQSAFNATLNAPEGAPKGELKAWDAQAMAPGPVESTLPARELASYFRQPEVQFVPVRDEQGRLQGAVLKSTWLHLVSGTYRPRRMGGMATPLGVHLTDGSRSGGPGDLALVLTGVMLSGLFLLSYLLLLAALFLLDKALGTQLAEVFVAYDTNTFPNQGAWLMGLELAMAALFLVLMRFTPLAGFHGAEHKTVTALEHGMPLTVEAIRPFTPVHRRCGTNLVALFALVSVFVLGLSSLIEWHPLAPLLYAVVALLSWRRLGSMVQKYLTTKEPTDEQLLSAIKAAEELTDRYQREGNKKAKFFAQIWNRGLPQVVVGGSLMMILADMALKGLDRLLAMMLAP